MTAKPTPPPILLDPPRLLDPAPLRRKKRRRRRAARRPPARVMVITPQIKLLAVLVNLLAIPGAGQLILGRLGRGLLLAGVWALGVVAAVVLAPELALQLAEGRPAEVGPAVCLFILPLTWLAALLDALATPVSSSRIYRYVRRR